MNFIESNTLTIDEHDVSTIKWKKPLNDKGIYDPTIPLELWQFVKLGLNDQIDYLLEAACDIVDDLNLTMTVAQYELPCSNDKFLLRVVPYEMRTRVDIGEDLHNESLKLRAESATHGPGLGLWSSRKRGATARGWFNYDQYRYVFIKTCFDKRWHTTVAYSTQYRTTFIWALLRFVIEHNSAKHGHLQKALDYYETSKTFIKKPRKYKAV